jgi:calcineurin-like phosphoesterase family protein
MLKVLKFKTKDQKVWFTSDLHWNHNPKWEIPIWKSRGFSSVEESNRYTINKINELVAPNDILFSLGDLTLNCSEDEFESFIGQINCRNIYCLWGNHPNPMAKIYKRKILDYFNEEIDAYPFRYRNIIFIGHHAEIIVDKQYINLNHYPIHIFNHMSGESWCLCGHSHLEFPQSQPGYPTQKLLDVGWDGYLKPLSFDEISDIMSKKNLS